MTTQDRPRIGRPPKVDADGVPTRERLLAAGAKMFGAKGYDATTLSDIARQADVSTPAIYNHFDDKDALFVEVARWALAQLRDRPESSLDPAKTIGFYLQPESVEARRLVVEVHFAALRNPHLAEVLAEWHQEQLALRTVDDRMTAADAKATMLLYIGMLMVDAFPTVEVAEDDLRERIEAMFAALGNGG